ARAAKEWLSTADSTEIDAMLSTGETVHLVLTAETFAELTATLVQKTLSPVRRALRDAGVTVEDVKGVVLVGGATRMPIIRRAVGQLFG
ncbi:Hsp70 family protein, partial [Klebsiella variicola]